MKYKSGTEWFRPVIKGDGSEEKSYFKKGRKVAFGNRLPLPMRKYELKKDLEKLAENKEHQRYFYVEENDGV